MFELKCLGLALESRGICFKWEEIRSFCGFVGVSFDEEEGKRFQISQKDATITVTRRTWTCEMNINLMGGRSGTDELGIRKFSMQLRQPS